MPVKKKQFFYSNKSNFFIPSSFCDSVVRDKVSFDGMGEDWMDIPDTFDPFHSYVPEVDHFLECIRTGKDPLVTPEIAANTVIASLYAVRSAKERTILEVPQI